MKINSKAKKIISSLVVTATIAMSTQSFVLAKQESMQNKEIKVYFNNEQIEFDQQPVIVNGRTKVPFRAIFETMGTIVYYRQSDKKILGLSRDGDVIEHTIGTNKATINGVEKTYDSVSEVINDRTLIPVRMVADLLTAEVEWKAKTRRVTIDKAITTNDYHKKIRGIMECALDQNFNPEDFKRYLEYQYNNWDMDPKQVVLDVNMDLDKELVERPFVFYEKVEGNFYPKEMDGLLPKEEDITIVTNTESNTVLVNPFNVLPDDYIPSNMKNLRDIYEGDMDLFMNGHILKDGFLKEEAYVNFLNLDNAYKQYENEKYGFAIPNTFFDKYKINNEKWWVSKYINSVYNELSSLDRLKYTFSSSLEELQTGLAFMMDLSLPMSTMSISNYKQVMGYDVTDDDLSHIRFYHLRTDIYNWLEENSYKYGFIKRYPSNKEHVTRHIENKTLYRYVGIDIEKSNHDNNWY